MLKSVSTLLLIFICFEIAAQKTLTEADYARAEKMLGANVTKLTDRSNVQPNWLADGRFWYKVLTPTGSEYVLINPKDGNRKTATTKKELLPAGFMEESRPVTKSREPMVTSPDGKKAVFIRDWNLWLKDIASGKETQLTTDGTKDFGYATDNAGWRHSSRPIVRWSPDSKKVATFQQDQRHVKDMYLVKTTVGAPELEQWKYPLPGDSAIIMIQRVIIETETPKVIRLQIAPDARRGTLCDDIACSGDLDDVEWSDDGAQLAFVSSSRDHKEAKFRIANAIDGSVRDIMEEKVATQYESGQGEVNWKFLPKTNELIWYSERDDWGHLYLYDIKTGKLKNQITKGNFVVTKMLKVDEKKRIIWFEANGKEPGNPYLSHFYSVDFAGKKINSLTPEEGSHSISLSPDGNYFIDQYSSIDKPNVAVLKSMQGKAITVLEKMDISRLTATGWKPPVPVTVKSANGAFDLYGIMFIPTNLDPSKKYPVINYIYPGPSGGSISSWAFLPARTDHQALAELGFVVVLIEGSCNPNRSKSFHDACYGNMAENTLPDQIAGLKQLAQKYFFLDLDKVGVWGHSGGGFATAAAILKYPDFYKVGISESGNHDNRNYEDDWGERYIGLLTKDASGKSNYQDQANQEYAKNLKGKLLIAHGNMDDNVPPYNSYLLVDALIKANKDFDLLIFPNARHGFGADSYYMMRRRWDYFAENLMGASHPKEYLIKQPADPRN